MFAQPQESVFVSGQLLRHLPDAGLIIRMMSTFHFSDVISSARFVETSFFGDQVHTINFTEKFKIILVPSSFLYASLGIFDVSFAIGELHQACGHVMLTIST